MIDNKTIREVVISDKLFPGGSGEPTYEDRTATGAIANFETNNTLDIVSGIFAIPYDENGYSSLNVTRCGVNMWDEDWEVGGIRTADGTTVASNSVRSKNFNRIEYNKTYYLSQALTVYIFFYDKNEGYLGYISLADNTFTTTIPNTYYFKIQITGAYGTTYHDDVSINYPSTDTSYHAYTGSTYPISWTADDVYGGDLNITTGKLLSKYDSEGNLLPDPVEISITPVTIPTLEGINNIYADIGKVDVIYKYQTGTGTTSKVNKWLPLFYPIRKETL